MTGRLRFAPPAHSQPSLQDRDVCCDCALYHYTDDKRTIGVTMPYYLTLIIQNHASYSHVTGVLALSIVIPSIFSGAAPLLLLVFLLLSSKRPSLRKSEFIPSRECLTISIPVSSFAR